MTHLIRFRTGSWALREDGQYRLLSDPCRQRSRAIRLAGGWRIHGRVPLIIPPTVPTRLRSHSRGLGPVTSDIRAKNGRASFCRHRNSFVWQCPYLYIQLPAGFGFGNGPSSAYRSAAFFANVSKKRYRTRHYLSSCQNVSSCCTRSSASCRAATSSSPHMRKPRV